MLGLLRRLCSLLSHLFFRVTPIPSTVTREPLEVSEEPWNKSGGADWDGGGDWEPFTVQVVPHDPPPSAASVEAQEESQPDIDLFSDMTPVFKKPTMIRVAKKEAEEDKVDMRKFSVQDEAFVEEEESGLGVWSDDLTEGWEETDPGDLVKSSREARKQRSEQRKLQQQEKVRVQQTKTHSLGTRVS